MAVHLPIWNKTEYQIIKEFYGDNRGTRSGVPYINHINEGLYLLWKWGANSATLKAFCLHPIVQSDNDFWDNRDVVEQLLRSYKYETGSALAKAIEYRYIANAYTSRMPNEATANVRNSPIEGVNLMLKADKIQNYKDAKKYVFPKSDDDARRLTKYFEFWMLWFSISKEEFDHEVEDLERVFPLKHDADTEEDVKAYFAARASQLHDYEMGTLIAKEDGVEAWWKGSDRTYASFYVYASKRGRGAYRKWYDELNAKSVPGDLQVLTTSDCNMVEPLSHLRIPYHKPW